MLLFNVCSGVAPSFSEISESIEQIIENCKDREDIDCPEVPEAGMDNLEDDGQDMDYTDAISTDHQLVLSCCWQTIKVYYQGYIF